MDEKDHVLSQANTMTKNKKKKKKNVEFHQKSIDAVRCSWREKYYTQTQQPHVYIDKKKFNLGFSFHDRKWKFLVQQSILLRADKAS